MQYNLQEILNEVALKYKDSTVEPMTEKEMKKKYKYFKQKFTTFTFNFAKRVKCIILLCDVEEYNCQELSVHQLYKLQKELKLNGDLTFWITLEIHFTDKAISYMSFDH